MEDESNNPETGTALDINEAADLISQMDMPDDSKEHTEELVEAPSLDDETPTVDETVETPEETFFDIDGEQVSLSEIRNSYLRQNDYTKKTQQIAEERRVYQQNQRDVNEVRQQALQGIEVLKSQLSAQFAVMEMPDFDFLLENDPGEYVRQKAQWDKREATVHQLYQAEQALRQKAAEHELEQHNHVLQETRTKFFAKYPELNEPAKSKEVLEGVTQILIDGAFTQSEIEGLNDFRMIDLLYRLHVAESRLKAVPGAVAKIEKKPAISVKENSRSKTNYNEAGFEKFNKSRSVNDAAALIAGLKF